MRGRSYIILHGRRCALSATQAQRLSALLERPGQLVSERDVAACAGSPQARVALARAMSRIRGVLRPHGYDIYALPPGRGFLLAPLEEPEPEPEGKEGC